tara:strand:+ start:105 stop:344 length:240 start_codon:yes stop_codon:yes gene_type:complete
LKLVIDVLESAVGLVTDCLDGGQTNDDDKGQHHRVLDRRWAIFRSNELLDFAEKTFHDCLSSENVTELQNGAFPKRTQL